MDIILWRLMSRFCLLFLTLVFLLLRTSHVAFHRNILDPLRNWCYSYKVRASFHEPFLPRGALYRNLIRILKEFFIFIRVRKFMSKRPWKLYRILLNFIGFLKHPKSYRWISHLSNFYLEEELGVREELGGDCRACLNRAFHIRFLLSEDINVNVFLTLKQFLKAMSSFFDLFSSLSNLLQNILIPSFPLPFLLLLYLLSKQFISYLQKLILHRGERRGDVGL